MILHTFENREVSRIVGMNPRILIDWTKCRLVLPDFKDAAGHGTRRSYSEINLVELAVVKALLGDAIKRDIVRSLIEYARKPSKGSDPPVREKWFNLSEGWKGENWLIINLEAGTWEMIPLGRSKSEKSSKKNLEFLYEKIRRAGRRVYILDLSALKAELHQKLAQQLSTN
mgnify:FL=1